MAAGHRLGGERKTMLIVVVDVVSMAGLLPRRLRKMV